MHAVLLAVEPAQKSHILIEGRIEPHRSRHFCKLIRLFLQFLTTKPHKCLCIKEYLRGKIK